MSWYSFLECYSIQKTIKIILYKVYPLKATVGGVIRPQGVTIRNRGSATAGSATRGRMVYDMVPTVVQYFHYILSNGSFILKFWKYIITIYY